MFVHRGGALLEDVNRARQTAGFVRRTDEGHCLLVIAGGDGLDRGFERLNGCDDAAERQKAQQAGQKEGRRVGDEHVALKPFDGRDGFLPGGSRRLLVMRDPFVRHLAETQTELRDAAVEKSERLLPATFIRQRHGLLRASNPLAAHAPVLIEQPPVLVAEYQAVRVLLQEAVHVPFVLVEQRAGLSALRVGGGQQMAAHIHAQFGETPGEIPQRGESHDPRLRHEPAARLDLFELQAGKDAKPQQRRQRHREQDDQSFGNRHIPILIGVECRTLACRACPGWRKKRAPSSSTTGIP